MFNKKYFGAVVMALAIFSACADKAATSENTADENQENTVFVTLTNEEAKSLNLQTGKLMQKSLSQTLKLNASLQNLAQNKAFVSTQMQGLVHSIPVQLGQQVQQGQVIAYVSSKEFIDLQEEYLSLNSVAKIGKADTMALLFNQQYLSLQEQYKSIEPQLEFAEKEVQRQQTLVDGKAGSVKQLQEAQKELTLLQERQKTLQAQMKVIANHSQENVSIQAQSLANQLSILGIDVKTLTAATMQRLLPLRAPISGKISQLQVRIGQAVDMQAPVAEIVNTDDLYLSMRVYEHQLNYFQVGQSLQFFVSPNEAELFEATVSQIGVSFDPIDKSTLVQAKVKSKSARLLEGLPVVAIINNAAQEFWTVPKVALAHAEGKDYIFALKSTSANDITFEQIYVEKLITTADEIGINIPQLAQIKDKEIAINQAFFVLGKMTNKGDDE